jgi:hypothetical protein
MEHRCLRNVYQVLALQVQTTFVVSMPQATTPVASVGSEDTECE